MQILNRLTIKNLKLNKKRTIVTIIGIILATALLTAVATMAVSLKESITLRAKKAVLMTVNLMFILKHLMVIHLKRQK